MFVAPSLNEWLVGWVDANGTDALPCPPPPRAHVFRPSANVRGSVGVPTPGTQVVVVDPVTHARLPDGQQGLLLAAGPGVMSGYWQDTAATHKAFIDGWFDTGRCRTWVVWGEGQRFWHDPWGWGYVCLCQVAAVRYAQWTACRSDRRQQRVSCTSAGRVWCV